MTIYFVHVIVGFVTQIWAYLSHNYDILPFASLAFLLQSSMSSFTSVIAIFYSEKHVTPVWLSESASCPANGQGPDGLWLMTDTITVKDQELILSL